MITANYIDNIMNKSDYEASILFNELYALSIKLPNGKILIETSIYSFEACKVKLRKKIRELEEYIELDKAKYNYDLSEEFIGE